MPAPVAGGGVAGALRLAGGARAILGGNALMVGMETLGAAGRIRSGENPIGVLGSATINIAIAATMGFLPAALVMGGFALAKAGGTAAYQQYQRNNQYVRAIRTPFSHSFQHTDATYAAQQRGLAAMGRSRGMLGAEAGMMNQLYGRR